MATIKLKTMVNINKETPKRILGFYRNHNFIIYRGNKTFIILG